MKRGLTVLDLTLTRRCPKSHVALARQYVPEFEAADDAPEGFVGEMNLPEALEYIAVGDMVQCRNNAPLASICWRLLKRGLKVTIAGREIGQGLIALIKRLKAKDLPALIERIEKYRVKETEKCEKQRNAESAKAALDDKCDAIIFLCEGLDSVAGLIKLIEEIFADTDESGMPKASVLLTTTHKAKGLEADTVWVLDPGLYPAKYAKQQWELLQEQNLMYVRDTRSKDKLYYITVAK